ncbi:uncharacterized protein TNCV_2066621 [Trichonephila clavipes]|uniref:Uncharacterized protein n=1 Tax=Trichonephila clavipes TaxID=2585209 RepID=A0A8X6W3D1_TRICX|nr:uncharacterized protein TNCV_2066621 [Trichonephila clavipes]
MRYCVPSRLGGTLNSRRDPSPLVRLDEGKEMWEAPDQYEGVLLQNWGGTEENCTVNRMVLKAKANDMRKILSLSHDEFRGP